MRLNISFQSALALGLLSSTTAFVLPKTQPPILHPFGMIQRQGWDNQDFLGALSGDSNDMDEANQKYHDQSRYDPDLVGVPPDQLPKQSASPRAADDSPEEELDHGGSRFKELLKAAKDPSRATNIEPPQYTPPPVEYTPPPQQQPDMPDMENLSVEDQARMFREFMAQQQPQQQSVQPPQPPPARQMPGGLDAQGRRIGRNKDADSIANTADLYFAQLKTDSNVRISARSAGDLSKANAPMQDESVKKVAEQLRKNPYLTAQQEQARSFVEGGSGKSILVIPEKTKTDKPKDFSGVNFRKRFAAAAERKKKGGQAAAVDEPAAVAATPVEETVVEEPVVAPPPVVKETSVKPPKAVVPPPVVKEPSAPVEPPKAVVPPLVVKEPSVKPPKAVVSPPEETSPPAAAAAVDETDEETRSELRTLMGLMLKHRGGPGFGAGRLKGQDAVRFESLLKDVTDKLRSEAGMPAAAVEEPITVTPEPVAVETPEPTASKPKATPPAAETVDPLARTMDCVEGVIAMYRLSAPEEKEGILMSVRAALMDAVNKCNKVIAEHEVANKEAYDSNVRGSMGFPDTYDIAEPEEDVAPVEPTIAKPAPVASAPAPVTTDSHTQLFANIYKKLEESSGDGEFGLKEGMSSDEAQSLADQLVEMRGLLLDELDSGIPESPVSQSTQETAPEPAASDPAAAQSSSSKYQKMLAKAKADKKAKGGM